MIYLKAISALILVLGLIGLCYYLVQRLNDRVNGGKSKRQIRVLERTPLGDKRSLLLVQVRQKQMLLGATNSTISMLADVPIDKTAPVEVLDRDNTAEPEAKVSFRKILEAIR
jgi:flagellar biosynthetic protein FliO